MMSDFFIFQVGNLYGKSAHQCFPLTCVKTFPSSFSHKIHVQLSNLGLLQVCLIMVCRKNETLSENEILAKKNNPAGPQFLNFCFIVTTSLKNQNQALWSSFGIFWEHATGYDEQTDGCVSWRLPAKWEIHLCQCLAS